jgi:hypothetical protein
MLWITPSPGLLDHLVRDGAIGDVETGDAAQARVILVDEVSECALVTSAKGFDHAHDRQAPRPARPPESFAASIIPAPSTALGTAFMPVRRPQPDRAAWIIGTTASTCNEQVRRRTNQQNAAPMLNGESAGVEQTLQQKGRASRVSERSSKGHGESGGAQVSTISVKDGPTIYYKDWGPKNAQPIVFHHGWPLSADDWDTQMLYFVEKGYRVIAHDRRGHGRSSQVSDGHDMDHYAADAAAVVAHLDLRDAIHIRPFDGRRRSDALCRAPRQGPRRQAGAHRRRAADHGEDTGNPGGLPIEVFDGFRQQLAANRAQFYRDLA